MLSGGVANDVESDKRRTLATTDITSDHSLLLSTSGRTGFTSREGLMLMSECSSARSGVMHFAAIWPICFAAAALMVGEDPLSSSWRRRSSLRVVSET